MAKQQSEYELDIIALAQEIWRYRFLIGMLTILGVIAGYGSTFFASSLYRAESKLLIEAGEPALTQELQAGSQAGELLLDKEAVGSQVELLTSQDLLRGVVETLNLSKHPQFSGATTLGWIDTVKGVLGLETTDRKELGTQSIISSLRKDLSIFPVDDSRVITVRYVSEDAALTQQVVSAMMSEYLRLQQQAKSAATRGAAQQLSSEIEVLRAKVQLAEKNVEEYRNGSGLIQVADDGLTLAQAQLTSLNADLAAARAARADAESRGAALNRILRRGTGNLDSVRDVMESETIRSLKQQKAIANAQIGELRATHLSLHPRVQGLKSQIEELDLQIFREAKKIAGALENDVRIASDREKGILAAIDGLRANAASAADKAVGLRALEREATAQRDLLANLLARYREAIARERAGFSKADGRVISHAITPLRPFFPKGSTFAAFGGLAGLLLGFLSVLGLTLSAPGVFRPLAAQPAVADQPAALVDPALQPPTQTVGENQTVDAAGPAPDALPDHAEAMPEAEFVDERDQSDSTDGDATVKQQRSPITLSDSAVNVAQLVDAVHHSQTPFLAVFAASEAESSLGEQISTVVARLLASSSDNLVIRMELLSRINEHGENSNFTGLADLIDDQAEIADIIYQDDRSDAHFIPFGTSRRDRLVSPEMFALLMEALGQVYTHVIFDAGTAEEDARIDQLSQYPMAAALIIGNVEDNPSTAALVNKLSEYFNSVVVVDPAKPDAAQNAA